MVGSVSIDLTNVSKLVISIKRRDCNATKCNIRSGQYTTLSDSLGSQIYDKTGDTHELDTIEYSGIHTIAIHCTPTAGTGIFLANIVAS